MKNPKYTLGVPTEEQLIKISKRYTFHGPSNSAPTGMMVKGLTFRPGVWKVVLINTETQEITFKNVRRTVKKKRLIYEYNNRWYYVYPDTMQVGIKKKK